MIRQLRWLGRALTDWRWPAAIAALLVATSLALSQFVAWRDVGARGETALCIARVSARFDSALADIIDLSIAAGTGDHVPEKLAAAAVEIAEAKADFDRIDQLCSTAPLDKGGRP